MAVERPKRAPEVDDPKNDVGLDHDVPSVLEKTVTAPAYPFLPGSPRTIVFSDGERCTVKPV